MRYTRSSAKFAGCATKAGQTQVPDGGDVFFVASFIGNSTTSRRLTTRAAGINVVSSTVQKSEAHVE